MKSDMLPKLSFYKILVSKKDRPLLILYARYLTLLARRCLPEKKKKPESFNLLYRAVSREWGKKTLLGRLQNEFIIKNLSLSLLLEPLEGAIWLSQNLYPLALSTGTPVFAKIAAPFSRFIGALNNQPPLFYQPFSTLAMAYAALYFTANSAYAALLMKSGVKVDIDMLRKKLPLAAAEAKGVLKASHGFFFRLKMGICLSLFEVLVKKTDNKNAQRPANTPSEPPQIMQKILIFYAFVKIFLAGLWYALAIKGAAPNRGEL